MIKKFDRVSLLERVKQLEYNNAVLQSHNRELLVRLKQIEELTYETEHNLQNVKSILTEATKRIMEIEQNRNSDW